MASKADIQDVRHRKLRQLREAHPHLKDAEFAEFLGMSNATYYSRLKSWPKKGSKKIGDVCRKWEAKASLPVGWFDKDESDPPHRTPRQITKGALLIAEAYDNLDKDERIELERTLAKILSRRPGQDRQAG